jgi:uncharacterized repeat protein (TIGR03803 family)
MNNGVLAVCATAMLAACGAEGASVNRVAQIPQSSSTTFRVLYNFGGYATDGERPEAPLVQLGGALYGTTLVGGAGCYPSGGCGTVFSVVPSGDETVVHSFGGGEDGAFPYAGLKKIHRMLYGTTGGGASTGGSVFSVDASGAEKVLYDFKNAPDASDPRAGLIDIAGTLYGTSFSGGAEGTGTVYKLASSDTESVLYSFSSRRPRHDGKNPAASLVNVDGTLYGTTYQGGTKDRGTVFKITQSGDETVLHNFQGGPDDGAYPIGGLVRVGGALYGTTTAGAIGGCKGCGDHEHYGTIFTITASGKETLLYRFKGYPDDGANPYGQLIKVNGTLYGTTETGGVSCAVTHGCGTIFSITSSGAETVLHSFVSKTDGALPLAGLIDVDGVLYGTTSSGGAYNGGTVFAFIP